MSTNSYIIRPERPDEHRTVEELVRNAFWNVYRPGAYEHYVLHTMRQHPDFVPELNFVLEYEGTVIGQTVFVRSHILTDDGGQKPTLSLGPICIGPAYQRRGLGKYLLDYAFEKAAEWGAGAVLFEGNIVFYRHSGCVPASTFGIRYHDVPAGEDASFFLCRVLKDGYLDRITGEYAPPDLYLVDDGEVEAFDRTFPKREKLKLPGQLF